MRTLSNMGPAGPAPAASNSGQAVIIPAEVQELLERNLGDFTEPQPVPDGIWIFEVSAKPPVMEKTKEKGTFYVEIELLVREPVSAEVAGSKAPVLPEDFTFENVPPRRQRFFLTEKAMYRFRLFAEAILGEGTVNTLGLSETLGRIRTRKIAGELVTDKNGYQNIETWIAIG